MPDREIKALRSSYPFAHIRFLADRGQTVSADLKVFAELGLNATPVLVIRDSFYLGAPPNIEQLILGVDR